MENMTMKQLKEIADNLNIKINTKGSKQKAIELIQEAQKEIKTPIIEEQQTIPTIEEPEIEYIDDIEENEEAINLIRDK